MHHRTPSLGRVGFFVLLVLPGMSPLASAAKGADAQPQAPKPQPDLTDALQVVRLTLARMARGGIRDPLAGGYDVQIAAARRHDEVRRVSLPSPGRLASPTFSAAPAASGTRNS